jgi:transglutaminase-like putative cysteine protease
MSHSRGRLTTNLLFAVVAAGTTWLAMSSWHGLTTTPGGFLNPLLLLALVIAGTGTAARWWRWPGALVVLVQVGVSAMLVSLMLTGSPLPVGGAWGELTSTIGDAVDSSQAYAAPIPEAAPPIDSLLILGGVACLLLVDALACTLRRASLAGLPLLAVFTIPAGMVGDSVDWWIFAGTAAGFLGLLFLQEADQVSRWGRPLGLDVETGDPISFGAGSNTVRGTAGLVGGAATALAVLIPVLIPATGLHVFDFGPGGGGGDNIRVDNPTANLVRDLKQGQDVDLVRITTNDPDPSYLRILTLTRFSDAEWSPGNREVPADNRANGQLPPPQGVAPDVGREEYPYAVTVLPRFHSRWLPTQPPVSRVVANGDWRYDDTTMDFIASDDNLSTASLQYTMTAVDLDLTSKRLADAATPTGKVSDTFTKLPKDLPPIVRDLAVQVTQDAATPYEKAVALQDWFREDGGFTYSLDRAQGNGIDALVDFLSDGPGGRTGYCEQFASAMAVMARMLGIPARVAIGFLNPEPDGPDSWVYSSRDMHAWPELYFDGAGWVRFEPTPAGRAEDVPAYTVPGSGKDDQPSTAPSGAASSSVSAPTSRPRDTESEAAAGADSSGGDSGVPWTSVLGGLGALLVAVVGLGLPRALRSRRRERRLGAGRAEPVWAELHDTAVDLGVPWPSGRSPRATRALLVGYLGAPVGPDTMDRPAHGAHVAPEAVSALDRLVHALELARYSRGGATADPVRLRADGEACVAALAGGATRSNRRRATWWPRSVVSPRRRRTAPGTLEAKYGGVVDHAT